jgi:hypothetical protein
MNFYLWGANVCMGIAVASLLMAEFGMSSLFGGFHPTHETAIAYAVISIALSNLAKHAESSE